MRRLILPLACALVLSSVLVFSAGCKRQRRAEVTTVEEESAPLLSVVHTGDPRSSIQLVKGFHEIEQNAWRWTQSNFSVTLRPPPGSETRGAVLEVRLTVPDPVIQRVRSTTLSAKIGGLALEPQTYATTDESTYTREIDASALGGEAVTIDFSVDKFLGAGVAESRELAIIVSSIGLTPK